jgi:hypothetical protein
VFRVLSKSFITKEFQLHLQHDSKESWQKTFIIFKNNTSFLSLSLLQVLRGAGTFYKSSPRRILSPTNCNIHSSQNTEEFSHLLMAKWEIFLLFLFTNDKRRGIMKAINVPTFPCGIATQASDACLYGTIP